MSSGGRETDLWPPALCAHALRRRRWEKGAFIGVNSVRRCLSYPPPFQKKHGYGANEPHFVIAAPAAYAFQSGSISPFKTHAVALNWRAHASDTLRPLQCCFFQRPCATQWIVFNSCGDGQGQNLDPSDPMREISSGALLKTVSATGRNNKKSRKLHRKKMKYDWTTKSLFFFLPLRIFLFMRGMSSSQWAKFILPYCFLLLSGIRYEGGNNSWQNQTIYKWKLLRKMDIN